MPSLKAGLIQLVTMIPPIRRLLAERDVWRAEAAALREEVERIQPELNEALKQLRVLKETAATQKQVDKLWTPPGHFYSPLTDPVYIKINEAEIFSEPPAIRGVDLNQSGQLELLKQFEAFYPEQPFTLEAVPNRRYFFENPNYSYGDAIFLYCMIRHLRPRRIVEVGSGYSSCAMLDVNELFFDNAIECTFIDPYPQLLRDLIRESDQKRIRIIGQRVQDVAVDVFRSLQPQDILFIDSSHVAKTGSDVNYLLFKILPLLQAGVYIHFHDVFYPFEYPTYWVYEGRSWNEVFILRAFLQYNRSFQIQFFSTFLMSQHRQLFESRFPICLKRPGGQLWLKKIVYSPELDRVDAPTERKLRPVPAVLDLSLPEHAYFLNDGWYIPDAGQCWMSPIGVFQIAGPVSAEARLTVHAWSSHSSGATLSAMADDIFLGSFPIRGGGAIDAVFPLPASLAGRHSIRVRLDIDRVHDAPGDPRKLGLAVRRIEVR